MLRAHTGKLFPQEIKLTSLLLHHSRLLDHIHSLVIEGTNPTATKTFLRLNFKIKLLESLF